MKISDPLNQFAQICSETINKCYGKVSKPFKQNIAEVLELYMVLNSRINFTQMGIRNFSHWFAWYRLT